MRTDKAMIWCKLNRLRCGEAVAEFDPKNTVIPLRLQPVLVGPEMIRIIDHWTRPDYGVIYPSE